MVCLPLLAAHRAARCCVRSCCAYHCSPHSVADAWLALSKVNSRVCQGCRFSMIKAKASVHQIEIPSCVKSTVCYHTLLGCSLAGRLQTSCSSITVSAVALSVSKVCTCACQRSPVCHCPLNQAHTFSQPFVYMQHLYICNTTYPPSIATVDHSVTLAPLHRPPFRPLLYRTVLQALPQKPGCR